MVHFGTKLELDFSPKNAWILACFLQELEILGEVCQNGLSLSVELCLESHLQAVYRFLDLIFTHFTSVILFFVFWWDASYQFSHGLDKYICLDCHTAY